MYSPSSHVSLYLTYNKAQYVLPTANDGAVATWGEDPTNQLRQNTKLEEGGAKFDLFDKRLFISMAGFYQERTITTGPGGVPYMLVAVNVAALTALAALGAVIARQGGRHAAWGLLLPAYFGLVTSLSRDTAEPVAAAFLVAGLLAIRARRPVLAARCWPSPR